MKESIKSPTVKSAYTQTPKKHIDDAALFYRKIADHGEDDVLTEDTLRKTFIDNTCCRKGVSPDELTKALLKR